MSFDSSLAPCAARFEPQPQRPLAPLTTLGLGGPAALYGEPHTREQLLAALSWARDQKTDVHILGGGSNLVVADAGVPGLTLRMQTRGITLHDDGTHVLLTAEAGELWQSVVDCALAHDLAGLECLTGIPGSAGATPIQNVGAYGQEVSDTLLEVEVLERATLQPHTLSRADCGLGYRDSRFKREPERFVVVSVTFRLEKHGAPSVRYAELARALAGQQPSLEEVASTVHELRARKSMLLDPDDPNGRSAGSFFKNPIVSTSEAARVKALCVSLGVVASEAEVPSFPAPAGAVKLAAGFLIERAGIAKGLRRGNVGTSGKHALCLVHHGGGSTRELLALAAEIEGTVQQRFGITLEMEPVRWG